MFFGTTHLQRFIVACAVWTACFGSASLAQNDSQRNLAGRRPNIILVMTDDQGYGDFSCFGNSMLSTPNLDRFYRMSTRFTDFHVSPTCAPTRSAIMSGRHEFRNGVTHTIKERERMALSTTTFPKLLNRSGYATGIFGKWHLGDEDAYQPYNRGFSEVFIHGAGGIGQSYPGSCADFPPNRTKQGRYFDNAILHNDTIVKTEGFCTDVFFQAALEFIKKNQDSNTPYFAYISTNAPHGPMIAPERYTGKWKRDGWHGNLAGRYGMVENIDDNFGLLMDKLDEWNAWDNTLVIFMTDNGQAMLGERKNGKRQPIPAGGFKTGKGTPYEGGTHVPAFWRWKGVLAEGKDISALTAHIDLFQTFCELAGVAIPSDIQKLDGRSLLPLLEQPKAAWKDRNLFTHVGRWAKGSDPNESKYKKFAIRSTRWRLVNKELYDIENDPYETTDVADQHPDVVKQLLQSYDQWWEETVPLMVNEDAPFAPEQPQAARYEKQQEERGIPDWKSPNFRTAASKVWAKLVGGKGATRPPFHYVENNPKLPNVLIYGDSISIAYTPAVRELLKDKANVYRLHCNGGETATVIPKITAMQRAMTSPMVENAWSFEWDVIHFNAGLHDLKYVVGRKLDKKNGKQLAGLADYEQNLNKVFPFLTSLVPNGKVIFATTTPVPENSRGRFNGDAVRYNEVAQRVLKQFPQVAINDLFALTKPNQPEWWSRPGDVHFNATGKQAQAEQVAKSILAALESDE